MENSEIPPLPSIEESPTAIEQTPELEPEGSDMFEKIKEATRLGMIGVALHGAMTEGAEIPIGHGTCDPAHIEEIAGQEQPPLTLERIREMAQEDTFERMFMGTPGHMKEVAPDEGGSSWMSLDISKEIQNVDKKTHNFVVGHTHPIKVEGELLHMNPEELPNRPLPPSVIDISNAIDLATKLEDERKEGENLPNLAECVYDASGVWEYSVDPKGIGARVLTTFKQQAQEAWDRDFKTVTIPEEIANMHPALRMSALQGIPQYYALVQEYEKELTQAITLLPKKEQDALWTIMTNDAQTEKITRADPADREKAIQDYTARLRAIGVSMSYAPYKQTESSGRNN